MYAHTHTCLCYCRGHCIDFINCQTLTITTWWETGTLTPTLNTIFTLIFQDLLLLFFLSPKWRRVPTNCVNRFMSPQNDQHTHTHTHIYIPSMPILLQDTPWCIPRTRRTGSWPQAWCWAVLSPWRSPAEALYAPLWVDPQGWAQTNSLKLQTPQDRRLTNGRQWQKTPQLNSLQRGFGRDLHPWLNASFHSVAQMFSRIASRWREWRNPPWMWSIYPFVSSYARGLCPSLQTSVSFCHCPNGIEWHAGGEIQPSRAQIAQGREDRRRKTRKGEREGGKGREEEKEGGVRSSWVPWGTQTAGVSLTLFLCRSPLLNTEPCTALQKTGVWRIPSHVFSLYLAISLSPSLLLLYPNPLPCLFLPPFWISTLCSVMQNRSNVYCAMWSFKAPVFITRVTRFKAFIFLSPVSNIEGLLKVQSIIIVLNSKDWHGLSILGSVWNNKIVVFPVAAAVFQ